MIFHASTVSLSAIQTIKHVGGIVKQTLNVRDFLVFIPEHAIDHKERFNETTETLFFRNGTQVSITDGSHHIFTTYHTTVSVKSTSHLEGKN